MRSDEHYDRLVDLLLWELVGNETPPDVRSRVLKAAEIVPPAANVVRLPAARRALPRAPEPSKFPALAAAAVVALLAGIGALAYLRQTSNARTPVLTLISGTADRADGPIPPGRSLTTGALSSAVITYKDGTAVELAPETRLVVADRSRWDGSKEIEIVTGRVEAKVEPQPQRRPMVLTSRNARAEIVGTELSFHVDDDRTRLEVTQGSVRFLPRSGGTAVLVRSGLFAEAGKSGFRSGAIGGPPARGFTGFTLMNAESDEPIREEPLADGETISLASLPTRNINIRADFEGDAPVSARIHVTRQDGQSTGVPSFASNDQTHPPFFAAGDHWAEGRPNDCRAWTPRPGLYRISAQAIYADDAGQTSVQPLTINFRIKE